MSFNFCLPSDWKSKNLIRSLLPVFFTGFDLKANKSLEQIYFKIINGFLGSRFNWNLDQNVKVLIPFFFFNFFKNSYFFSVFI